MIKFPFQFNSKKQKKLLKFVEFRIFKFYLHTLKIDDWL